MKDGCFAPFEAIIVIVCDVSPKEEGNVGDTLNNKKLLSFSLKKLSPPLIG